MVPDIEVAKALDKYYIYLKYETGEERIYDMTENILEIPYYNKLKSIEYFKNIKPRGDTVEWANGEDVAPENLYYNSIPISEYNGTID